MIKTLHQGIKNLRVRKLLTSALVFGCALGTATHAKAQNITAPPTPAIITPEPGNVAFLVGHAQGTQGYVCLPKGDGASWTVNNSRPGSHLFFQTFFGQDVQIITHFLSPNTNPNKIAPESLPFANVTWQSSFDSSRVWAQTVHAIDAGSDPSCRMPGQSAASCCSPSGRPKARQAVIS